MYKVMDAAHSTQSFDKGNKEIYMIQNDLPTT
jgi:hypothetical protein